MRTRFAPLPLLAVALLATAAGCGDGGALPRRTLLATPVPVTLGNETRLASGPELTPLLRAELPEAGALPRSVSLPPALAGAERLVLHARALRRPDAPPRLPVEVGRRTQAVAVREARLPLDGVRPLAAGAPLTLQISAGPLPAAEEELRFEVTPPHGARLELGYGLREESWHTGASATRFRVAVVGDGARTVLFEDTLDPDRASDQGWRDARIDLAAFAERAVTLALHTERAAPAGAGRAPSLPVWSNPALVAPGNETRRPSLLVVSVDTLRARSVGAYGYLRDTTPFLDAIAAESAVFENAMTPAVTTGPAHMSLFTGLYPTRHGMLTGTEPVAGDIELVSEALRDAGYQTAAFTEDGYLIRDRGFGRGFERYVENRGERLRAPGQAALTFAQARRWLAEHARPPFLLFVHTYEVHSPYDPPERHAALFAGDGAPGPGDALMRRQRDNYDREIRAVDDELRALFATLEAETLGDRTVVVLLSDHGEEFAEHGRYQHGGAVYDEVLDVPLVFWGPGRIEAARHAAPVSLIDVAPTLLELAGLPVPGALDGTSLVPALRGAPPPQGRTLYAEARAPRRWLRPLVSEVWNPPLVAVRSGDTKFIVHRPRQGARQPTVRFDLAHDPGERAPQRPAPDEARRIETLVDGYLGSAPGRPPPALDPELEERLRRLGYLE